MFIVQVTVVTIVNYNRKMFMVQATDFLPLFSSKISSKMFQEKLFHVLSFFWLELSICGEIFFLYQFWFWFRFRFLRRFRWKFCLSLIWSGGTQWYNHRHLSNIHCLKVRTACLVGFNSTVNGHCKKRSLERLVLVACT